MILTQMLLPEDLPDDTLRELYDSPDKTIQKEDKTFLLLDGYILCCENTPAGSEFIRSVRRCLQNSEKDPRTSSDPYYRIITDADYSPEQDLLRHSGVRYSSPRCVVLFRDSQYQDRDLFTIIASIIPTEPDDAVIPINRQSVVLIKNLEYQSEQDIREFSEAVIGTLETEGISGVNAGIGGTAKDITGIRSSYLEAHKALKIGEKYNSSEHVHIYACQLYERIIDEIPDSVKVKIRCGFFDHCASNRLSEEMLETVQAFFKNDLNLTATARELYIHRNTLNYRLDKFKKDFGLDLRSFHDAVAFKIISSFPDAD